VSYKNSIFLIDSRDRVTSCGTFTRRVEVAINREVRRQGCITANGGGFSRSMQYLVTNDVAAERSKRIARGGAAGAVQHKGPVDTWVGRWSTGLDPRRCDYASFADLTDTEGNTWALQERGHRAS
jgi:hypothetical protein